MSLWLIQIAPCLIELQTVQPHNMLHAVYRSADCLQNAAGSVAAGISPSVVEHAVHWALSELRLQGDTSAARQQHMLGQTIKAAKVNSSQQLVNRCSNSLIGPHSS